MNILMLASQSTSRARLLTEMDVSFVLLDQYADESSCDWALPLPQLVQSIAEHKMEQVILPTVADGQEIFVLTADTLTQSKDGTLLPKPLTREAAISMLHKVKKGARVGTSFCLDLKKFEFGRWQIKQRITKFVEAECVFDVPEHHIEDYLANSHALRASGAITIEGYGAQFFKSISGSYTTIMGLPLAELRQALKILDFF